jgi:hypothetical protein
MGTRHLICVVKNGEYRVAKYGQWDGYYSGQGQSILNFLIGDPKNALAPADISEFSRQVDKIKILTPEEVTARWDAVKDKASFRAPAEIAHLGRDIGADILDYILDAEEPETFPQVDFAGDSLFCEFCYVLNLDTLSLEVYRGFNKEQLDPSERFFGFETRGANKEDFERRTKDGLSDAYYPVKHVKTIPFSELTPDTMKQLEDAERDEDEDGEIHIHADGSVSLEETK